MHSTTVKKKIFHWFDCAMVQAVGRHLSLRARSRAGLWDFCMDKVALGHVLFYRCPVLFNSYITDAM